MVRMRGLENTARLYFGGDLRVRHSAYIDPSPIPLLLTKHRARVNCAEGEKR